jgi:hypothetical protein
MSLVGPAIAQGIPALGFGSWLFYGREVAWSWAVAVGLILGGVCHMAFVRFVLPRLVSSAAEQDHER